MTDDNTAADGAGSPDDLTLDAGEEYVDLRDREYAVYRCTDCANVVLSMQDCGDGLTCHESRWSE